MCTDRTTWPAWALAPACRATLEILVPEHNGLCSPEDKGGRAGPVQQLPAGRPPFSRVEATGSYPAGLWSAAGGRQERGGVQVISLKTEPTSE